MLELIHFQEIFIESLKTDTLQYYDDPLSNRTAVHISGTQDQAEGIESPDGYHKNLWFKKT